MTHGRESEGETGEWSTLHTTSEHGVSSITTADAHTSAVSIQTNWPPPPHLNGLVHFAKGKIWLLRVCHHISNAVYSVPSHFKRSLQCAITFQTQSTVCHHISNAVYNMAVQSQTCVNSEPTCHLLQTDGRCSMDLFLGSKVASPNYLLHPTYLCLQFTIITHILLFLVLTVLKPNS